jgi:glutaredoxin
MDDRAKRILSLFDELDRPKLDLHALFELAGGNDPAEREAVLDAVTRLAKEGLLAYAEGSDFYTRTEAGRLAIAGPREVTLYTRSGCHLCDEAKAAMAPILREFGATLREVDIDQDAELRERYTNDVPVIFLGPRKIAKHRLDPVQFRHQLEQAAKRPAS